MFSTFNAMGSSITKNISRILKLPYATDYIFSLIMGASTMPTTDEKGLSMNAPMIMNNDTTRGYCFITDGTSDRYITLTNYWVLPNTFSISFWIYSTDSSGYKAVLGTSGTTNGGSRLDFSFQNDSKITFATYGGSAPKSNVITTNTWHHLIATYNNSTGLMSVYQNGSYVTAGTVYTVSKFENIFTIATNTARGYSPVGKMDNIRIWNRVLTTTEITDIYTWELANPKN